MDLQSLTEQFATPGILTFAENEHGLIRAIITTPTCTAELYLQGAHLTSWRPMCHEPVLFLSDRSAFVPGKAIRGGIPIVFPWFGARTPTSSDPRTDSPSHGFARISQWQLAFAAIAGDDLHLTLTLSPSETSRSLGFDNFQLAYTLVLGAELELQLTVLNTCAAPLHFEEAFHPYLSVGDARRVSIIGLSDTDYLDKTDDFKRKHQTESPLRLAGETDRPYLSTEAPVDLDDPVLKRRVTVNKAHSKTTVVWNPWSELSAKLPDMAPNGWLSMTCIETANAAENAVTLNAGCTHTMQARISVQRYAGQ